MTRRRVWGIAAVLLAIVAWIGAFSVAASSFGGAATFTSPGPASVTLAQGNWTVFQFVPESTQAVMPADVAKERTINVEQVKVTGPDGKPVSLTCSYCDTSQPAGAIPVDLRLANPVGSFQAAQPGQYSIAVDTGSNPPSQLAVANPLTRFEANVPWIALLSSLGVVLLGVGIVLIIAGRGGPKAPTPAAGPEALPPGWYPNPYQPGTDSEMWWDGSKWTSNWR